jgi:glycosyltransferase involved in cell wall biosynthesis
MNYSFSIIIPVYNTSADVLSETLSSIASAYASECSNIVNVVEILVINDGSSICYENLKSSSHRGINIRWIFHSQNLGRSAARNTGIEHAQGDLISFIDSDDVFLPVYFSELKNALTIASGERFDFFTFGYYINRFPVLRQYKLLSNSLENYMQSKYFHISSAVFHKSCIGNLRFSTRLEAGEDIEFLQALILKSIGLHTNVPITRYNFNYKSYDVYRPKIMRIAKYFLKHMFLRLLRAGPRNSIVA